MPNAILLDFDGTAYLGDLAVQAYARRVAELLDVETGMWVVGGMRAFLEGRPAPAGMPPEFDTAEDGFELVHALSVAAEVPDALRRNAYAQSRVDLAGSAFALDPQPGLTDWLAEIKPVSTVWVVTNAPITGLREVLDTVGLLPLVDEIIPGAGKPAGLAAYAERAVTLTGEPGRVLAIGDRWAADLAAVHAVGGRTAHLDRFGRALGTPTWRATDLEPLLPALHRWADTEGAPR